MANSILAYLIEGLGSDTTKTLGLALYHGLDTPSATDSGGSPLLREWWPCVEALPPALTTSVNPYSGDWSTSALSMELSASDRVAALLMRRQREIDTLLTSALTAAATTVTIGMTSLAGQPIWIDDETILLGTHTGGGTYTGCTRGFWGSTAATHAAEAGVYTSTPTINGRLVSVIEHNPDTGVEVIRWRGFVTSVEMSEARITVQLEELLTVWSGAEINRDAPSYTGALRLEAFGDERRTTGIITGVEARVSPARGGVYMQTGTSVSSFGVRAGIAGGGGPDFDGLRNDGEVGDVVDPVFEILYINRSGGAASTSDLTYPYHPLAIALALLMSTGTGDLGAYDVLGSEWGLGIDYVDLGSFEAQITAHPDLAIDRLVLGWDGAVVNVFDVIERVLLKPFGYFLTVTATGLVGVGRLRLLDIQDWSDATSNAISAYVDGPLRLDRAMESIPQTIIAEVGAAPWTDGQRIVVREATRSTRLGRLQRTRETQLDYQVLYPQRLGIISGRSSGDLSNALVNLLQIQLDTVPRLHIRVADYQQSGVDAFDLGNVYRVSDISAETAWIVDNTGARTVDLTSIAYAGMLIGRTWDPSNYSYELELLLLNFETGKFVRWRAPAAVVASNVAGVLTCSDVLGGDPDDARTFTAGDEVYFWTVDGVDAALGLYFTVLSTAANTITIDSDPGDVSGLVLRLVASTVYSNTNIISLTPRPYAYLASDAQSITEADASTSTADIYGTEVYSGEQGTTGGFGATFVGLDDDVFGPESSSICLPLDSYLEHRLRSNERRIIEDGGQVSWCLVSGQAGSYDTPTNIRPYASAYRSTVLMVPWLYQPGLVTISAHLIARVSIQGTQNAGAVGYRARLESYATQARRAQQDTLGNTDADTPEAQPFTIDLDVTGGAPASPIITREIAPLILWGQSDTGGTPDIVDTSIGGTTTIYSKVSSDVSFYDDSASSRPNNDQLDLMATRPLGAGGTALYDHFMAEHEDGRTMVVTPQPRTGGTLQKIRLSYMQLRGLEIAQTFDDDSSPASSAMRAKTAVLGETEGTHALRLQQTYTRARCLWIGPVGDGTAAESAWPNGYVTRHIYTNGTISAGEPQMLTAPVLPSTDNPRLLIMAYVIPTHADLRVDGADLADLGSDAPTAPWAMWATVEELTNGASEEVIGDNSTTPDVTSLTHYFTDVSGRYPAMLTRALLDENPSNINASYKEGQLYDEDLGLVSLMTTTVQITRDASLEVPAVVRLFIQLDDDPDYRGAVTQSLGSVKLQIVGVSIWELT